MDVDAPYLQDHEVEDEELGIESADEYVDRVVGQLADPAQNNANTGRRSTPPDFAPFRAHLLETYRATSADSKKVAKESYAWLSRLFMATPRFGNWWRVQMATGFGGPLTPSWILSKPGALTSLVPPITEVYQVNGEVVHGLSILLGLALDLNPKLKSPLEQAIKDNRPIDARQIVEISLGDARKSASAGVYGLTAANGLVIIGHAVSSGFIGRLDQSEYSKAKAVKASLGLTEDGGDQRTGRSDAILFSLDRLDLQAHLRWYAAGLKSLAIIMWRTTDPAIGMNSRISDPPNPMSSISPLALRDFWGLIYRLTSEGHQIPPQVGSEMQGHQSFYDFWMEHLKRKPEVPNVTWRTLLGLIFAVYPYAQAADDPHFPPLSDTAFLYNPPKERGARTHILRRQKVRTKRGDISMDQVHPTLHALMLRKSAQMRQGGGDDWFTTWWGRHHDWVPGGDTKTGHTTRGTSRKMDAVKDAANANDGDDDTIDKDDDDDLYM